MENGQIASYKKAGEITAECQALARRNLKVGTNLFEFAEQIESAIRKKGGKPAFPINLSKNNVAAHYTPEFESKDAVGENDVIKVDIGVHVNGFIADSARTIDFSGKHEKMVEAAENALEEAVKMVKEGLEIGKIGSVVEKSLKAKGFNPIRNLSGHGVDEFDAHTAPTIPNIANNDPTPLEDGQAFAIEPFATDGAGFVREGTQAEIFQLVERKGVRDPNARKILNYADENYMELPFAERWIQRDLGISDFGRKLAIKELLRSGAFMAYPVLKEEEGKTVTQAETTLVLSEGKVIRLL